MLTTTQTPSSRSYAPDAVIYDLSPPLGRRGMNRDSVAAWLAGWDGPIQIDARDVNLTVDGDVAFASALNSMRGRIGGKEQDLWYRSTVCLRKTHGRWRIVHDHTEGCAGSGADGLERIRSAVGALIGNAPLGLTLTSVCGDHGFSDVVLTLQRP